MVRLRAIGPSALRWSPGSPDWGRLCDLVRGSVLKSRRSLESWMDRLGAGSPDPYGSASGGSRASLPGPKPCPRLGPVCAVPSSPPPRVHGPRTGLTAQGHLRCHHAPKGRRGRYREGTPIETDGAACYGSGGLAAHQDFPCRFPGMFPLWIDPTGLPDGAGTDQGDPSHLQGTPAVPFVPFPPRARGQHSHMEWCP